MTRGADLIVDGLVATGVRTIFGVPGDTGVVLYDALHARTADITHVLTRDERHAVAMADAYARVSNRPGAVEVSSGGGVSYAVGGLGEAYAAGVPVVVVTSDVHVASRGTGALTEIDQRALFAAVTKAQYVVERAAEVPGAIARACAAATEGRPAPVVVIVAENALDEVVEAPVSDGPNVTAAVPARRMPADPPAVAEAVRLLAGARRPAALVGGGAHWSTAYDALARLADRAGLAVATSIHGKGAFDETSPWALGVTGNNGGGAPALDDLADADVVLLVGTRANATDTNGYTAPSSAARVIAIDVEADRAGRTCPGALPLVGDAATVLDQLADAVEPPPDGVRQERAERIRDLWAAVRPPAQADLAPGQLDPAAVCATLREIAGPNVALAVDPGTPTPNVAAYWTVTARGRSIVVPRGHGPMGYAIPAAVGASFARPGQPVLGLTADGSFAMACGELETIARLCLPIVLVQLTNNSLGWIKMLQHLYTGQRYFGVDPGPIDAVAVAEACGVPGVRPKSIDELRDAVTEAVTARRPLYVDVEVPHLIDHVPPVPAWHAALAGDAERPVY